MKKIFELNCQCNIHRNGVEIEQKGIKGKLRKLILKSYSTYEPSQLSDEQTPKNKQLKQQTITTLFQQKQSKSEHKQPQLKNIDFFIVLYQGTDEIIKLDIKNLLAFNINFINQGKLTLQFKEESIKKIPLMLMIKDCDQDTLNHFFKSISDAKNSLKQFQQSLAPNSTKDVKESQQQIQTQQAPVIKTQQKQRKILSQEEQESKKKIKIIQTNNEKSQISNKNTLINTDKLTRDIIILILKFLPQKMRMRYRLVNQDFNQAACSQYKSLDLSRHNEIPKEVLQNLLNIQFPKLTTLRFGKFTNIPVSFITDFPFHRLTNLKLMDLGYYSSLSDKGLIKLLQNAERIESLILPYNSKITFDSISFVMEKLNYLTNFKLKSRSEDINMLLDDSHLGNMLGLGKQFQSFEIPIASYRFFDKFKKSNNIIEENKENQLIKLKLRNIIVSQDNQIEQFMESFKNLKELKIHKLSLKKDQNMIPYKESQTPLYNALKEMNTLTKISFKGFCNDELCRIISSYINLTEIKIISLLVTDIGMEYILESCTRLKYINIEKSFNINGHCFEKLPYVMDFRELEIKVIVLQQSINKQQTSFDQYRINCLKNILMERGYVFKDTTILKWKMGK